MTEKKELKENEFELSTGVILRGKPMPPGVFINLQANSEPPEMPKFRDSSGQVYTNPDDPDYIEKKKHWEQRNSKNILNAMIVLGTEIVFAPKTIPDIHDNGWVEDLETVGISTKPDSEPWRKLWWTMTYAALTELDWEMISRSVGRLSGVPEEDVDKASKFPGSA